LQCFSPFSSHFNNNNNNNSNKAANIFQWCIASTDGLTGNDLFRVQLANDFVTLRSPDSLSQTLLQSSATDVMDITKSAIMVEVIVYKPLSSR